MVEIVREFGLPVALIVFFVFFGWKFLWPFITNRITAAETQVDKVRAEVALAAEQERQTRVLETQAFLASLKEIQADRTSERSAYMATMSEIRQLREKEREQFLQALSLRDDQFNVELAKLVLSVDKLAAEVRSISKSFKA